MHFEKLWLDICQNFTGSLSTNINICLVWVVLRGPVEIQRSWKAGTWIYACCLAFRAEEEVPVMTLALKSQAHGSSAAEAMLSLAVLSCVPWSSPGAAGHGRTPLPWTAPGEKLICDGRLVSHRNRATERPKRQWLTSNTLLGKFWPRNWTFSGLRGMGILSFS